MKKQPKDNFLLDFFKTFAVISILSSPIAVPATFYAANSPLLAEHRFYGQIISINVGQYTIVSPNGSKNKVTPSKVDPRVTVGTCGSYYDLRKIGNGQKLDSAYCLEGLSEYGRDDGAFGVLETVSKSASQSRIQLGSGFFLVDEPSYSALRQNTGIRFRYNDYRNDGGKRVLTEIR